MYILCYKGAVESSFLKFKHPFRLLEKQWTAVGKSNNHLQQTKKNMSINY